MPIEPSNVLYVQIAAGGRFRPAPDVAEGGELLLEGVANHTIWFTERPEHRAGAVQTVDFATGPVFAGADPPNAALVAEVAGAEVVAVVELTNPRYDATAGTVTYDAVSVPGEPSGRVLRGERELAEAVPEQFGSASLFIDGVACLPYGGSCSRGSDCCSGQCLAYIVGGRIVDFLCT